MLGEDEVLVWDKSDSDANALLGELSKLVKYPWAWRKLRSCVRVSPISRQRLLERWASNGLIVPNVHVPVL